MYHLQKATQVTPDDAAADDPRSLRWLADHYATPAPAGTGDAFVRANMVASIDGAATFDGKSGALGGDGDKAVFRVLRACCDVVLVGARTAVDEGYRQPGPDDVLADDRARRGQAPAPALGLLSNSLSIPTDYPPLTSTATVILTCTSAPHDKRAALLDAGATLIDCGDEAVDLGVAIRTCAARGWPQVLTEGGPSILGACIDADLIDELCVTTSPNIVAGNAGRIAHHDATPHRHRMVAAQILTDDDGFVFTRWTRDRAPER